MPKQEQQIQLVSPVMTEIPTYIVENSLCQTCGGLALRRQAFSTDRMDPESAERMLEKIKLKDVGMGVCACEKPDQIPVLRQNQYKGKTVCICGSGPSLAKTVRRIKRGEFDHVWGCNDALMWLSNNGYPVTHGVAIDQSPDLYESCWTPEPPDVPYFLATSVSPKLIKYLHDHGRSVSLFHSHIGFDHEHEMYGAIYEGTALAGEGLNVVNRAIGVAEFLGYDPIYVAGADCAFSQIGWRLVCKKCNASREENVSPTCRRCGSEESERRPKYGFHVHGDEVEGIVLEMSDEVPVEDLGGRRWATKPDMLISAISLVDTKRRLGGRLQLLGDTLPKAMQHKDRKFLDRCIRWARPGEAEAMRAEKAMKNWAPSVSLVRELTKK